MNANIPFNKPFLTGKETFYIEDAVKRGKISGNGYYTGLCQDFFQQQLGAEKCLLTTSCTDALEMAAILLNLKEGDEVIMPSYTFVSTANAFILHGASIKFADSETDNPNIQLASIEKQLSAKTKAIVVVHYAGIACDMDSISALCKKHNLYLIEDAAQAIDSYCNGKILGSWGDLAAFSFHETKNIISGEGGMLAINNPEFVKRAEIIWEKGTNRAAFFRGEIDKYNWVDIGSSFLPSEVTAAFLYAQINELEKIQNKRKAIWNSYLEKLRIGEEKGYFKLQYIPEYASPNGHLHYILCNNEYERDSLIAYLKKHGIHAVFHYQALHKSPFFLKKNEYNSLPNCEEFEKKLLRLPLYFELTLDQVEYICSTIFAFYSSDLAKSIPSSS